MNALAQSFDRLSLRKDGKSCVHPELLHLFEVFETRTTIIVTCSVVTVTQEFRIASAHGILASALGR